MAGYDDQVAENPVFQATKEKLDSVGSGMCLAKWTQVTLQYRRDTTIPVTTRKRTKLIYKRLKEIHRHFITQIIKRNEEKKCYKVEDRRNVSIVGM